MYRIGLFILFLFIACDNTDNDDILKKNKKLVEKYQWTPLSSTPQDILGFSKNDDIFFLTEEIGWAIGSGTATVYKTTNGGENWTKLFQAPPGQNTNAYFRSIGFLTEQIGYVGVLRGKEYGTVLFETRDGGSTWNAVTEIDNSTMQGVCGISVVNENILIAGGRIGGNAHMAMTTDQGLTWKVLNLESHISMITDSYFWDENNGIVTGGYITGYFEGMPSVDAYNGSTMRVIRTTDGGLSWTDAYKSDRPAEWGWKFSFVNKKLGFASIQSRRGYSSSYPAYSPEHILKTKDGGKSWTEIQITDSIENYYSTQGIGFINEYVGWIGSWSSNTPMRYTYDGGKTWIDSDYIGKINRFRIVSDNVLYAISHDILKVDLR